MRQKSTEKKELKCVDLRKLLTIKFILVYLIAVFPLLTFLEFYYYTLAQFTGSKSSVLIVEPMK